MLTMPVRSIPVLLTLAVGTVLGLVAWGLRQVRGRATESAGLMVGTRSDVLVWLLALAVFILSVFVSFVVVRP